MLYYIDLPVLVCQSKYIVPVNNLLVVLNPLQTAKTTKECSCNVMNYNYIYIFCEVCTEVIQNRCFTEVRSAKILFSFDEEI